MRNFTLCIRVHIKYILYCVFVYYLIMYNVYAQTGR